MSNSKDFRNKYPIILVHGFCGWGRDEVFGFKYWGGDHDIERKLNDLHYQTYSAAVGPISSSWERAVELYYYLVGGTVDYGAAHAKKYGILRYGRTFPGIYPQISDTHKVHLIGHSMGAQTACDLEAFLRDGSKEEQDHYKKHPEEGISELFLGKKDWIHSITGVAPAYNGTTLGDSQDHFWNYMKQFLLKIAELSGSNFTDFIFDFKLEQWGLQREEGEYFVEYMERIANSRIWTSKDTAFNDLSIPGAAKITAERLKPFPETYYFNFHGDTTFPSPRNGHALPIPATNPVLYYGATYMGQVQDDPAVPGGGGKSWWPSDGAVPCIAAQEVFGQPKRNVTLGESAFSPGEWHVFPVLRGWDHIDFVGINWQDQTSRKDIMPLYTEIAQIITSTENGS